MHVLVINLFFFQIFFLEILEPMYLLKLCICENSALQSNTSTTTTFSQWQQCTLYHRLAILAYIVGISKWIYIRSFRLYSKLIVSTMDFQIDVQVSTFGHQDIVPITFQFKRQLHIILFYPQCRLLMHPFYGVKETIMHTTYCQWHP